MELFYSTGVQILLYWGFLQGTWKNKLHIGKEKSPQKCSKDFIPSSWKFYVCFLIGRSSSAAWGFNNYQEEISRWYYLLEHRLFIKRKRKKERHFISSFLQVMWETINNPLLLLRWSLGN